jgi:DNA repair protein RecN (Recombination protein N)
MLEEVVVSNLGLIATASIEPAEGLTVITGETGAGKTVMLGALRLLVGEQATKGLIGPHGDSADVSARFLDTTEHIARRVVAQGKSKAYLDGAITTASVLRETIGSKVSIVGQHDQHTITSSDGVRRLIDTSLTSRERKNLQAYAESWEAFDLVRSEADRLGSDQRHLARELETTRFQITEIADADFSVGDEELLRDQANRLRNAEELATSIDTALEHLGDDAAAAQISEATRAIESAVGLDASLSELSEQMTDLLTSLSDITADVVRYSADLDVDPAHLQETEQRVALLSSLKRKYGDSLEAILDFKKDADARETELAGLLDSADDIAERLDAASATLHLAGETLRTTRQVAADRIAKAARDHLTDLGFTAPIIDISVLPSSPTHKGADTATVLFASDESLTPGAVSSIASGGELSRLVLALTLASGGADTDIVAFDEIDAGIGGETALAMGRKLASLASTRQVLCVTHLPQVAAFADKHYVVERSGTSTTIAQSTDADRTEELSRMLAGLASSEKGKEHAEELLAMAAEARLLQG